MRRLRAWWGRPGLAGYAARWCTLAVVLAALWLVSALMPGPPRWPWAIPLALWLAAAYMVLDVVTGRPCEGCGERPAECFCRSAATRRKGR